MAKFSMDEIMGAYDDFILTTQFNPKYAKAFEYKGLCEIRMGKKEDACADFKKAESLGDKDATLQTKKYCF